MKIDSKNAPAFVRHLEKLAELEGSGFTYAFTTYEALNRLERKANRICTHECNGTIDEISAEKQLGKIKVKVLSMLPNLPPDAFFINGDPRGYSLKVREDYAKKINMYQDWGGYGILAPEF